MRRTGPRRPHDARAPTHRSSNDRAGGARDQLIAHATPIFAAKGFAGASTREICEAAEANVAAIHYYFGDKEGLYRAVLLKPITEMTAAFGRFDHPALPFEASMQRMLTPFLMPPGAGDRDLDQHVKRLHLREMLEPSPAFREITEKTILPVHTALTGVIARHCGLRKPDPDIHQLAFAMIAMANDYCLSREIMKMLAPSVLNRPKATELILNRLVGYSRALLDHEIARRRKNRKTSSPKKQHASRTHPSPL
jgi:AcrR family transcriptional regulator